MITLLDVGFALVESVLSKYSGKLPAQLVTAGQAAVDAWAAHRDDVITKANLEAQRG